MTTSSQDPVVCHLMKLASDLRTLHGEYESQLQPAFIASLNQQKAIQKSEAFCEKQVKHLLHNISPIRSQLARLKASTNSTQRGAKSHKGDREESAPGARDDSVIRALTELDERAAELEETIKLIKRNLPAPSGLYLYLVLGSIRVSMPSNSLKLNYKLEYEHFKLAVTWALLLLSIICLARGPGTRWDPVLMFGLVWFYCTLTIRESILKVNGSNINGWWRCYHFLATGLSGVTVLWADKEGFQLHLRGCFLAYTCVVLVAHQMQYRYQAGTLYRLQTLGAGSGDVSILPMDISVEGVRSLLAGPMLRDFFLLMPFLYAVYLLQLLMVYLVVEMVTSQPELATWHAAVSALLFGVMFIGNVYNTTSAIYSKCTSLLPDPLYLVRKFH